MSKKTTLEMFKEIKTLEVANSPQMTVEDCLPFMCEKVESELRRLEAIDNTKPSEAMECLDYIENKLKGLRYECERTNNHRCDDLFIPTYNFDTIKQALQQAEKEHKALEIIKKRQIDVKDIIDTTDDFELYQAYCIGNGYAEEYICNKEEFDLLKEVLKDDK